LGGQKTSFQTVLCFLASANIETEQSRAAAAAALEALANKK
jgi:hypothetical protein